MTQDQANQLKVGDRVQIQRKPLPTLHYGTVYEIASEVRIDWEPYQHNGNEYGGKESHEPQFMSRIERA